MLYNYRMLEETFERVEQIGSGKKALVFKAYHKRLRMYVILKKIKMNWPDAREYRREMEILKRLSHPFIPQIYDFMEFGQDAFIVMEYVEGASFLQLLSQGVEFSQADVCKWMRQLCEVAACLHGQTPPVLHCDIKPGNVMLTPQGDIRLIDFDISNIKGEAERMAVGYSENYSPPEQFALAAQRLRQTMERTLPDDDWDSITLPSFSAPETGSRRMKTGDEELQAGSTAESVGAQTDVGLGASVHALFQASMHQPLIRSMSESQWEKAKQASEFLGDHAAPDERTDIYGIGATMYHILTGQKPRPFYVPYLPVEAVKQDVNKSLAIIINKALQRKPQDRFAGCEELLKAMEQVKLQDGCGKRRKKRRVAAVLQCALFAGFAGGALLGWIESEKGR